MASEEPDRILSIQSHVSFGYVGGKAAVFPLQCLGYDVDVVNTVNFSNHSGYGRFGGSKTTAEELDRIFDLMKQNGLLSPARLLTGYIPGADALSSVAELARTLRVGNADLVYLLDPVMGDSGQLYVAPEVVPIYRSILPLATIITPNWFEVETLTQVKLTDATALGRALTILHEEYKVPNVVMSSLPLTQGFMDTLPKQFKPAEGGNVSDHLLCICSSRAADDSLRQSPSRKSNVHAQCLPSLPGYFSGVGDLFSALVLAHFKPPTSSSSPAPNLNSTTSTSPQSALSHATSLALSKTYAILQLTGTHAAQLPAEDRLPSDDEKDAADPQRKVRRMRGRELRLVQGQDIIRGEQNIDCMTMVSWDGFWSSSV